LCGCDSRPADPAPKSSAKTRAPARSPEETIRTLRNKLEQTPDDPDAHSHLAAAYATLGRLDEATAHFREVVRIQPSRAEAHFNLGNALAAQERFEEAIPPYRSAIDRRPDYARAHNNLAVALKNVGRLDEAYRHIHEARRLKLIQNVGADRNTNDAPTERGPTTIADESDQPETLDALTTEELKARQESEQHILDPQRDGWDTEVIAEKAKEQMKHLFEVLAEPSSIKSEELAKYAVDTVVSHALRPENLAEVFADASLVVRRSTANATPTKASPLRGHDGLAAALTGLAAPLKHARDVHSHVKVIRVTINGTTIETKAYFDSNGQTDTGVVQLHASWVCQWVRTGSDDLLLSSIRAEDYEEVESHGGRWLSDCTSAVLGANPSFRQQLSRGLHHWLPRIGRVHNMHAFARYGVSVGDVNGDGLEDIYLCQPGGLPNRLFVQNNDGTCRDTSSAAGVDWLDQSASALMVDLDNDGDQDLVTATILGVVIAANDSKGKFERKAFLPLADIDLHGLSAIDYDSDGDLDLYVTLDFATEGSNTTESVEFVYHDANDGGANHLFRNDLSIKTGKDWKFTDVTADVGLDVDNRRHSLAASWEDYDNDGDPDLYVANDYGQNCLYRNDGRKFTNVASEAGVVDFGSGMSVSWGDYNQDGWMDLYVGNMFSSAGNRITRQSQFRTGAKEQTRQLYRRFAKGNSLFENRGDGTFEEVGAQAAVEMGRWAWSSLFTDLNNDGLEDLLVANGYITTEDTGDL
jgi:hypothetical protein